MGNSPFSIEDTSDDQPDRDTHDSEKVGYRGVSPRKGDPTSSII